MELKDKISIFRKEGITKIQVITDFDQTLTYGYQKDGKIADNSFSVFRNRNIFSQEYSKIANELHSIYYPIEQNPNISYKEKSEKMHEWWSKHMNDVLLKQGLTVDILDDIASKNWIKLRLGVNEFFKKCNSNKIPIIIFSAGDGDLIERVIKHNKIMYDKVDIIANFYEIENGKLISLKGEIIHSMNKDMHDFKHLKNYEEIKTRKNVILIGDKVEDLNMVKGYNYDNIIRIGFLNKNIHEIEEKFLENFDIVIKDDNDFSKINELLTEINSPKS